MKNFTAYFLNLIFFAIVIALAISVATISLTKKVNEYRNQNSKGIKATVIKDVVPVLSFASGVVKKLYVREGEEVKKGDMLVEMDNPVLKGKIDALNHYQDNISAQTESRVAQEELKHLKIVAPFNGVVGRIQITEGSPVENLSNVMIIYSNDNIRISADLSINQYQAVQKMHELKAYNERLNQNITIQPDILRPEEKNPTANEEKKISMYFKIKNNSDANSLLQNEDMGLDLHSTDEKISKPIDLFVDFWNGLLARDKSTKL